MKSILMLGIALLGLVVADMSAWGNMFFVDRGAVGLAPPPANDVNWIANGPDANLIGWQLFYNFQPMPVPGRSWNNNLGNTGNTVFIPQQMGLFPLPFQAGDKIDAFDVAGDRENGADGHFFFSVDNLSLGLPGTDVALVARAGGSVFDNVPGIPGSNQWCLDATEVGLSSAPGHRDDLGDYEFNMTPLPLMILTLDAQSPTLIQYNLSGADIAYWDFQLGIGQIVMPHAQMGLFINDDIDALKYLDVPVNGYPNFHWAFSLSRGSPTLALQGWSAADIILGDGNGNLIRPNGFDALSLGLDPEYDNIDALDTFVDASWANFDGCAPATFQVYDGCAPGTFSAFGRLWASQPTPLQALGDVAVPEPASSFMLLFGFTVAARRILRSKRRA